MKHIIIKVISIISTIIVIMSITTISEREYDKYVDEILSDIYSDHIEYTLKIQPMALFKRNIIYNAYIYPIKMYYVISVNPYKKKASVLRGTLYPNTYIYKNKVWKRNKYNTRYISSEMIQEEELNNVLMENGISIDKNNYKSLLIDMQYILFPEKTGLLYLDDESVKTEITDNYFVRKGKQILIERYAKPKILLTEKKINIVLYSYDNINNVITRWEFDAYRDGRLIIKNAVDVHYVTQGRLRK